MTAPRSRTAVLWPAPLGTATDVPTGPIVLVHPRTAAQHRLPRPADAPSTPLLSGHRQAAALAVIVALLLSTALLRATGVI